jgi:hypothetical protein
MGWRQVLLKRHLLHLCVLSCITQMQTQILCMYVCMYIYICIYIYVHTHTQRHDIHVQAPGVQPLAVLVSHAVKAVTELTYTHTHTHAYAYTCRHLGCSASCRRACSRRRESSSGKVPRLGTLHYRALSGCRSCHPHRLQVGSYMYIIYIYINNIHIHIYIYIYTHIHIHTHAYIHTYIYNSILIWERPRRGIFLMQELSLSQALCM